MRVTAITAKRVPSPPFSIPAGLPLQRGEGRRDAGRDAGAGRACFTTYGRRVVSSDRRRPANKIEEWWVFAALDTTLPPIRSDQFALGQHVVTDLGQKHFL